MLTRKPSTGDRLMFASFDKRGMIDESNKYYGTVKFTEGNICWVSYDGKADADCFIWKFNKELNRLATIVQEDRE